ncbi:MAG: FAD-dependent oxidoreductase [Oscillospiraceae bacterium]
MKVIIIGGVAGGASAAARLRRLDEKAEIIILERSGYVSYANCGLPYYIGGVMTDRDDLTVQTPESLHSRFAIDVRVGQEALSIDRSAKTVTVKRLSDDSVYTENYDRLVLAPGAKSVVPPLPGADGKKLFSLRTVEDTIKIYDYIEQCRPASATVIGGGFIGLEMAENLKHKGLEVTVVQRSGHVLPTLDDNMAEVLHKYMRRQGIKLRLNSAVAGFEEAGEKAITLIKGAESEASDMIILAVGVAPENSLAAEAGLATGIKGAIKTDEHMQTADENIYAVGDAVEVINFVTGEKAVISLAGPANKQGRIAADNICGIKSSYGGSQGSSIMKMFDMTVASTGLSCKQAESAGISFDYVVLSSASHATYYPGSENMTVKVIFQKDTGRIIGAQLIGFGGVDKRIDVLATAVRAKMTAHDLTQLDLAYAPPFSSAKDPVNMAGYAIENLLSGCVAQIHWEDVAKLPDDALILDTRTDGEYAKGHLKTAMHIPVDDLRDRLTELPRGRTLYVYCQSGLRSYVACRILSQNGFDCLNVSGGFGFCQYALPGGLSREGTGPCGISK